MVRKVQKAKAPSQKATASVKKPTGKAKKANALSNGHAESEGEKVENKTVDSTSEIKSTESRTMVEKKSALPKDTDNDAETESSKKVGSKSKLPEDADGETESSKKVESRSELPEDTDADGETKSSKKVDSRAELPEDTNITDETEQEPAEEVKSSKAAKYTRKRKIVTEVVKEKKDTKAKTKAKRQKVLLEIPKINSVSGKVFVIGENDVGQLGLGEAIPVKKRPALLELPHSVVDIAAGGMHSVCLTESGEVITFGCNDEGALGRITVEEGSEYIPKRVDIPERIVQVSAGDSHSAALSDSGHVYIWGNFRNVNGPMGLISDGAKQTTPVRILSDVIIVKIASGSEHLVCLSQEGVVYTCGCGEAGQLGRVSEHASVDGGRKGKVVLLTPDKVPVLKSSKLALVNNIWTGSYTTFMNIQDSGGIYAFGLNNFNQLGFETQTTIMRPKHVVSFNNKIWSQIFGGQHHTLALDENGLVYALGRTEYGRLGLGEDCDIKSVPTEIPKLQDKKCVDISCGNIVSFAVADHGSVFSWGMGDNHQLGHGDDLDKHTPHPIKGNFSESWKAYKIAGGGQHTLILATPKEGLEK